MTLPPVDPAALAAHEAIRQLAARYALAVDRRDLDTLCSLFVTDVDCGAAGTGRGALRDTFEVSLREVGITVLHVGTQVIDLDGDDRATGVVYCHGEVQDGDRWIHQAIVYDDAYRRDGGRWFFVRRCHRLVYGAEVGVNPLTLPEAHWPARPDGRGVLPEAWPTWQRFWARPSD
jgi:hypothetical protein